VVPIATLFQPSPPVIDATGRLLIGWTQCSSGSDACGGDAEFRVLHRDEGGTWSNSERFEMALASIVAGPAGRAMVVGCDALGHMSAAAYREGLGWAPPERISSGEGNQPLDCYWDAAMDGAGSVVVGWWDRRTTSVHVRRFVE
jgi:hypothetical protein